MALAAYRHLLRSTRIAFQGLSLLSVFQSMQLLSLLLASSILFSGRRDELMAFPGDFPLLHAARIQARQGFDSLRLEDPDSEAALKGIEHAEQVAEILTKNIVQGVKREGDDTISTRRSRSSSC